MAPCQVHISDDNDITVVSLEGTLEHGNVVSVKMQLEQVFMRGRRSVIIDMKRVTHANSDGLGSLISILKMMTVYRAKVMLINVHGKAADTIKVCKLDQILPIFDLTLEQAKEKIRS